MEEEGREGGGGGGGGEGGMKRMGEKKGEEGEMERIIVNNCQRKHEELMCLATCPVPPPNVEEPGAARA